MKTSNKKSRVLGAAFLFQAVTSLASGMIMKLALTVPGSIGETMARIAQDPWLMRANLLGESITAAGIVVLGAVLFTTLRKENEKLALSALALYILEAALLAASRIPAFSLLRISQEYAMAGQPAYLLTLGNLAFESMEFGYTLLMLPCCLGIISFYYLLYKSAVIPRALSLWGLISAFPMLVGTLAKMFGYSIPFAFYLPYVPFEFAVGLWILVKGVPETSQR